jgi:putative endonuclease
LKKLWIASSLLLPCANALRLPQAMTGSSLRAKVMTKQPCVYIVASKRNGTLYAGVTSDLAKRAFEHREGLVQGFSSRYHCKILIWYELHATMIEAITREKQIKAGSRARKLALIEDLNPDWKDLYDTLI